MAKQIILTLLKTTVATIFTTLICLLILTFALYKLNLQEKFMDAGIVITYFLSNFVGGFLIGKVQEKRRFAWGALLGFLYFIILLILSLVIGRNGIDPAAAAIAFVACVFGGTIGGIVS